MENSKPNLRMTNLLVPYYLVFYIRQKTYHSSAHYHFIPKLRIKLFFRESFVYRDWFYLNDPMKRPGEFQDGCWILFSRCLCLLPVWGGFWTPQTTRLGSNTSSQTPLQPPRHLPAKTTNSPQTSSTSCWQARSVFIWNFNNAMLVWP